MCINEDLPYKNSYSGFHLDIDSRDGKIMVFRNKGWQGCYRALFSNNSKYKGMAS